MSRTKTLVFVIADSSPTGASRQVFYLMCALKDTYVIHCICPPGWLADAAQKEGVAVHYLDQGLLRYRVRQIRRIFESIKPDIIHCHGIKGGTLGRLAANEKKSIIIYTEYLWTSEYQVPRIRETLQLHMLKRLSRRTHHTIAVSDAVKTFLLKARLSTPEHTTVIYGATETVTHGNLSRKPVIGTMGRVTWIKGIDVLLKALPTVIEQIPQLQFRIGGTGPAEKSLKYLAHGLGIERHIEWLGEIGNIKDFYRGLQIYVQPSRNEALGLPLLEAMSAGVPVLAARVGVLPEIIEDTKSGLFFPTGNSKELSHQLAFLLTTYDVRKALRQQALRRVGDFSIEKMANAHDRLYQKLLKKQAIKAV